MHVDSVKYRNYLIMTMKPTKQTVSYRIIKKEVIDDAIITSNTAYNMQYPYFAQYILI
jgi:uncharacterized protein (DUF1919 family)